MASRRSAKTVSVVLGWSLSDDLVNQLRNVSPLLHVTNAAPLVNEQRRLHLADPGSQDYRKAEAKADEVLGSAEVLLSGYRPPPQLPTKMPALKWVQQVGAGVDFILRNGPLGQGITLTNARGLSARPMAEWAIGAMLMFAKRMPLWAQRQKDRNYLRYDRDTVPVSLEGATLGILGLGAIGSEIALLGKAFGMRVLGTRRSINQRTGPTELAEEIYPISDTKRVIQESDFLTITLPQTKETIKSFGRQQIAIMKPTAYLLNVGRGTVVDENALIDALRERRIAGAALDVFETEPLPQESPLWDMANVIFSPHISGAINNFGERLTRIFSNNLLRYISGEALLFEVDQEAGY